MQLRVLGCQGGSAPTRHLPGLLLDGTVLLEAGSVTATLDLAEQLRVEHVLLSHAHLDHIGGLAYLADNRVLRIEPAPETAGRSSSRRSLRSWRTCGPFLQPSDLARLLGHPDGRGIRSCTSEPLQARSADLCR